MQEAEGEIPSIVNQPTNQPIINKETNHSGIFPPFPMRMRVTVQWVHGATGSSFTRETTGSFLYRKTSRHRFFPSITCDYFPTDSQASMGRALDLTSRMLPLQLRLRAHQMAIVCFRGLVMAREEVMHTHNLSTQRRIMNSKLA